MTDGGGAVVRGDNERWCNGARQQWVVQRRLTAATDDADARDGSRRWCSDAQW
ncbi:peptidase C14 [Sesbania bispinosa]|nr:peptidase C14 [Sesbania bispinosa]